MKCAMCENWGMVRVTVDPAQSIVIGICSCPAGQRWRKLSNGWPLYSLLMTETSPKIELIENLLSDGPLYREDGSRIEFLDIASAPVPAAPQRDSRVLRAMQDRRRH